MFKAILRAILIGIAVIPLGSCDDMLPGPNQTNYSLFSDGSQRRIDKRLKHDNWGVPYYISEDIVFQLSAKIYRRSLNATQIQQLIPDSLAISDQNTLEIDVDKGKLYFAANNHIYSCSFSGTDMINLSRYEEGAFSSPALSDCRNYLTAIRSGSILSLNLLTGEWIELEGPTGVVYAVYVESTDEYFYFAKELNSSEMALWRFIPDTQASTMIMKLVCESGFNFSFSASPDRRYFALQSKDHNPDITYGENLLIYDRQNGLIQQIDNCFTYAFDNNSRRFYFSRQKFGLADLNYIDLQSGATTLVWDGYISQTSFSYSINRINLRADGLHMFISGYTGYRFNDYSKGSYLCTK